MINNQTSFTTRQIPEIQGWTPSPATQTGARRRRSGRRDIAAEQLTLVFQGKTVCEQLSFLVPHGGTSVLAPHDALCKAALFALLAGRLTPIAGSCLMYGHKAHDLPLTIRRQIAVLENIERTYEVMTIGQTAIFFSGCYPEWRGDRYTDMMESLGFARRMKICNLANHQRVLVALAVLIAQDPELLILDDWVAGFDPQSREAVYDAIHRYRSGSSKTTILLGNHVGLTPDLVDHLILVGHSTSLTLPATDLFAQQQTAPISGERSPRRSNRIRTRQR